MSSADKIRVVAVTSGKGGVGKTTVATNLAVALAKSNQRVAVLDADLGLANVDVLFGLQPRYDLSHVVNGDCSLSDIVVPGPAGVAVVPGASGLRRMTDLSALQHSALLDAFGEIGESVDVLLVDTATGISDVVMRFTQACQDVLVVVCDEPASITDAYALIKLLSRDCGIDRLKILPNRVGSVVQGRELFYKLSRVTERYLDVVLEFVGILPEDEYLGRCVRRQDSVLDAYPGSKSALAFRRLARHVNGWPHASGARGRLQFFLERLIDDSIGDVGLDS